MLLAIRANVIFGQRGIIFNDENLDGFALALVRDTDDRALHHAWAQGNHVFQLIRKDIEARNNNHVLFTINDLENVISLCPGVVECAVVGVSDQSQGEAIKVFVSRTIPL